MQKDKDTANGVFYRSAGMRPFLRPLAWHSPFLFWPVAFVRHNRNLVCDEFDVMVDGYQRSANTYLATALQSVTKPEIRVWTHFHSPAAVLASLMFGKPTIVLVRRPRDAVTAWTAMSRYPIAYTLSCYIEYYEKLIDYADLLLFIKFEDVTTNINAVLGTIGQRFPKIIKNSNPSLDFHRLIIKQIEDKFVESHGAIDEQRISRPSQERVNVATKVRADLASREWKRALGKAEMIYATIISASQPGEFRQASRYI